MRNGFGVNNSRAKLSESDVLEIYARSRAGENCSAIAREFRLHRQTILQIKWGRSWATVTKAKRHENIVDNFNIQSR